LSLLFETETLWVSKGSKTQTGRFENQPLERRSRSKIQQQTDCKAGGFKIVQQLSLVATIEYAPALQFDDDSRADNEVRSKYPNGFVPKPHCDCLLAFDVQALFAQGDYHRLPIHRLQKSMTQFVIDLVKRPDNWFSDL